MSRRQRESENSFNHRTEYLENNSEYHNTKFDFRATKSAREKNLKIKSDSISTGQHVFFIASSQDFTQFLLASTIDALNSR